MPAERDAVSEAGLYQLVVRSDLADAKEFQDWVTREILPSIRQAASYRPLLPLV